MDKFEQIQETKKRLMDFSNVEDERVAGDIARRWVNA